MTQEERDKIERTIKRNNFYIWKSGNTQKVIETVEKIRDGTIKKTDWVIENVLTYEDYCFELGLFKYI